MSGRDDPADFPGLGEADGDATLEARVVPRSSRTELVAGPGGLRIKLCAPPVDGAANAELRRFLAKLLGVPKSHVVIAAGAKGRTKKLLFRGRGAEEVRARLRAALRGDRSS